MSEGAKKSRPASLAQTTGGKLADEVSIAQTGEARADKALPAKENRKHFQILNREAILADQEPEWLIEGLYTQDSLAQVFGVPEAYKTFFALAVGCSVATGKRFLDIYNVKHTGDVVYIYGEGGRGIGKRLTAWEVSNGCTAEHFFGIAEPVDMLSKEPERVIADIKAAGLESGADRARHDGSLLWCWR